MVDITIRFDDNGEQEVVIRLESGMTVIARQSSLIIEDWEETNEVSYDDILYLGKDIEE